MPSTEYRAVLVCTEAHSSCTPGDRHVLMFDRVLSSGRTYVNGVFPDWNAAGAFARRMMSTVWGSWHTILIEARAVTDWAEPLASDPAVTDPRTATERTFVIGGSGAGSDSDDEVRVRLMHDGTIALQIVYPDDDSFMTVYPNPETSAGIADALLMASVR